MAIWAPANCASESWAPGKCWCSKLGPDKSSPSKLGLENWAPADWAHLDKVPNLGVKLQCSFKFCMQIWPIMTFFVHYSWMQHSRIHFACRLQTTKVTVHTAQCTVHGPVHVKTANNLGMYVSWIYVLVLQSQNLYISKIALLPLLVEIVTFRIVMYWYNCDDCDKNWLKMSTF